MKDANAKAIIITSLQSPSELFTGERLVLSVVWHVSKKCQVPDSQGGKFVICILGACEQECHPAEYMQQ